MASLQTIYQHSPRWVQSVLLNAHALRIHHHRFGRSYRDAVASLVAEETMSRNDLARMKNARLRRVISIAHQRSRYYREVMDRRDLTPADIRTVEDLPKLPLLTKEILRKRASDIMTASRPRRGWWSGHTSGTTGSPLSLWYDRSTCVHTNAVDHQHKRWSGVKEGEWIGLLLGRVIVSPTQSRPPFWRCNFLHRQVWFSSFHLSDEHLSSYVAEIRRRGLEVLEGYPSTLFVLAKYLLMRSESLPLRAVITSSETLHDIQRTAIEEAFACPVFDFYALAERTIFAGECQAHEGKHISEGYGHVEVTDRTGTPRPPGSSGYLVGTSLHNTAMPLLRYQTSDISVLVTSPCPCGITYHRIGNVSTKAEDLILTPEGRWISPSILTHPFKPLQHVRKSQIRQDALDRIRVSVVVDGATTAFWQDDASLLHAALQERLGQSVHIEIVTVDDIPREPSGKFRWVVSHVGESHQVPWNMGI